MTQAAPEPVPDTSAMPPPPDSPPGHIEQWIARHVAPDLADIKTAVEKVRELAPELKALADAVVMIAKAADPATGPEITAAVALAEGAAEAVGRIAGELTASGM